MSSSPTTRHISRRSNTTIITNVNNGQESLPTLGDLKSGPITIKDWLFAPVDLWRKMLQLPNGDFISDVLMRFHLDPRLADPSPDSHDVFLIVRPRDSMQYPLGSFKHWSFYCQGHFYHLSAPGLRRDAVGNSQNASKGQGVSCQLDHEDWSALDSEDWNKVSISERQKPLMALKVGQTDYRTYQILQMASWIIEQLPSYNIFDANCQHFVRAMVSRTVMRLCDRSVFIGSKTQIVNWSLEGKDQRHVNSVERGWIVAPPLPGRY